MVIGRSGTGYDKIDLEACTEHGVAVFNAPMALNHPTASSALLFMLALAKRLFEQERLTRQGRWDRQAAVMGSEIRGRTLGIVGLGHTGASWPGWSAPFAMRVLAFSPHADPAEAEALGVRLTSLEEVLRESDFLSLHCRLTAATRGLIGPAQLALMKPTAYFINVARGELVDQAALTEALRARRIAGAALDVFAVEPLPLDDPLLALDNVILTPHWSASTSDVWAATGRAMAEGMLRAASRARPGERGQSRGARASRLSSRSWSDFAEIAGIDHLAGFPLALFWLFFPSNRPAYHGQPRFHNSFDDLYEFGVRAGPASR